VSTIVGWKIMKLKIIRIKYILLFILYNKFIIINIIIKKLMFPKFFGLICNNEKKMIKLLLMTSHMSFMIMDEMCHIMS
jgi:hypothetical protein